MSVNKELLEYGLKGEEAVLNYLTSFGFDVVQNRVDPEIKSTIINNLKYGDITIHINDTLRFAFDVKRGLFVSETSINRFIGQFYILIPKGDIDDIENARVVKNSTIKRYFKNTPRKFVQTGPSGQTGYRFTKLKNYVLLEDFVANLIKRLVILKHTYSPGERDSWSEYLQTFNKVLPRGVVV